MHKNFIATFFTLVLLVPTITYPVRLQTVQAISGVMGVGSGLGIRLLMNHGRLHPVWSTLGGVTGGATLAGLTYLLLYQFTPEGRTEKAIEYITQIEHNPITQQEFTTEKEFLDALQNAYVMHDLWLIAAFRDLSLLLKRAQDVLHLVDQVQREAPENSSLLQQCEPLVLHAHKAIRVITQTIKKIRENKEYIAQLKIQKEQEMRERELQVEKEKAQAQQQAAAAQWSMALSNR
jgi:hypothetical protein